MRYEDRAGEPEGIQGLQWPKSGENWELWNRVLRSFMKGRIRIKDHETGSVEFHMLV